MTVFLIGFMGAGKSAVSRELSMRTGIACLDTDTEIEKRAGKKISEIFSEDSEACFRDMETALLRELAKGKDAIVSCGGGLVLREENQRLMKESGITVCLTASPETIYARVCHSASRPLLNGNMNVEYIRKLMEERSQRYLTAADHIVSTDGQTVEEVAETIQRMILPVSQRSGAEA